MGDQGHAAQHRKADAGRHAAEARERRNIHRVQALRPVDPVAHGGARERGDTQVVPEGIGDERREEGSAGRHLPLDIAQPEHVVATQQPVTRDGAESGGKHRVRRRRAKVMQDIPQVSARQFVVYDTCHASKDQQRQGGQEPAEKVFSDGAHERSNDMRSGRIGLLTSPAMHQSRLAGPPSDCKKQYVDTAVTVWIAAPCAARSTPLQASRQRSGTPRRECMARLATPPPRRRHLLQHPPPRHFALSSRRGT